MTDTDRTAPANSDPRPVGVVGLGYVGLPLAAAFVRAGVSVLGFDASAEKLARLARGESPLAHLDPAAWRDGPGGARLDPTGDLERVAECRALLVCVPTPLGPGRAPDLAHVEAAADALSPHLVAGQLVVLCSTTYPGTTREVLAPRLAASGLRIGEALFVAYSPEREDPGRRGVTTRTIPRLVGGLDAASTERATALLALAVDTVHPVSSAEVAEAAKLHENVFRAVNIALVNEQKQVLERLGIDVWEVLRAAATKPFGYLPFEPGPGLGGHCIPVDPFYLAWVAERAGRPSRFVELAGEVNAAQPAWVVERLGAALAARGRALGRSRVLLLGVAYKPDVGDLRGSPGLELLARLHAAGAEVAYHDPHVGTLAGTDEARALPEPLRALASAPLDAAALERADAVLLATHHAALDLALVAERARLVVDTRGALRDALAGDPRWVGA